MPPQGSTISCNRTSEWSSFEHEIVKFSLDGDLILCGDLNARTGTMCDYIESDSEMPQNSPLTYIVDQDYPRVSQDLSVNTQGRCLLDICIGSRLRSSGKYTCYTPNGCSVVDYVIVSADIQHIISRFSIHPLTMYSDHSPLTFSLKIQPAVNQHCSLQGKTVSLPRRVNKQAIAQKLNNRDVMNALMEIDMQIPFETTDTSVKNITTLLTGLFPQTNGSRFQKKKCFPHNTWFDAECKMQKRKVNDAKKKYTCNPHIPSYRDNYHLEKKKFKKINQAQEIARICTFP